MLYALNDPLASFVFIDCIIVWKCMLKCVLRVRIKIYIYYLFTNNNLVCADRFASFEYVKMCFISFHIIIFYYKWTKSILLYISFYFFQLGYSVLKSLLICPLIRHDSYYNIDLFALIIVVLLLSFSVCATGIIDGNLFHYFICWLVVH